MVMLIIPFILTWLIQNADPFPYDGYYGEGFARFHDSVRRENIFLQSIFNYIEQYNSTSDSCLRHLKAYKKLLAVGNMTWAKLYLDSSGDMDAGFLSGNVVNLGAYDQCIAIRTPDFGSNYCLIKVELKGEKPHRTPWIPNNTPIMFSLCVPDSCGNRELEDFTHILAEKYNFTVYAHCQSTRPTLTAFDFFILVLFACIGLITLSTVIPVERIPIKNQGILKVWSSFNMKRNLRTLSEPRKGVDMLSSLHALRFFSQCVVTWYHVVLISLMGAFPFQNKFVLNEYFRSWIGLLEVEMVLIVDTLFLVAGLLLTYTSLKKKSHFDLLKYYIHRYMRLTPPLAACVLIYATFANKLCNGPLCDVTMDNDQELCRRYWWTNMLYINNFYPGLFLSCMPQTWYLAVDWQLFMFVSPLVVIVTEKWPNHLNKLIGAIFLASFVSLFLISFLNNVSTDTFFFNSNSEASNYYYKMYTTPHTRAGPWAIGMYLGIILHNQKNKPIVLPLWGVAAGWVLSFLVLYTSVEVTLPLVQGYVTPSPALNAFIIVCQTNAFALAVAWIIFASSNNMAGPIGKILNWRVFEPLGKISYSTYLIHKIVVGIYIGETRSAAYFSKQSLLPPILGLIVLSFFAGFLLYLTFEAPAINIEKLIFQEQKTSNESESTQPADESVRLGK